MAQRLDRWGYPVVTPRNSTTGRKSLFVHRLVLYAFAGPPPDGHECRHLDGNSRNNHASNLCWGTHSENIHDVIAHGNHIPGGPGGTKLTDADVRAIRAAWVRGNGVSLAAQYGVHPETIRGIVKRRLRRDVA
jgi:hypothetical protein